MPNHLRREGCMHHRIPTRSHSDRCVVFRRVVLRVTEGGKRMLAFDRRMEPPPTALQSDRAKRSRREMRNYFDMPREELLQTRPPKPDVDMNDPSIMAALNRLFRGKCAFCESRGPLHVHLFRPMGNASPTMQHSNGEPRSDGHLYYAWLATAWENYFPICDECRPYDANFFPVQGDRCPLPTRDQLERFAEEGTGLWRDYPMNEKAMLLDPTHPRIRPSIHLQPSFYGNIRELSESGRDTIEFFNLNSGDVIQNRSRAYHSYMRGLLDLGSAGSRDPAYRELFAFEELEFGGTWYLLLRRVAERLIRQGAERIPSAREMPQFFARRVRSPSGREDMQRVVGGLDEPDIPQPSRASGRRGVVASERSGLLELRRLEIFDFKGIETLSIELPPPMPRRATRRWTAEAPSLLLLGENAAGKTTILEAIALALSDDEDRNVADKPAAFVLNPEFFGSRIEGPSSARIKLFFKDVSEPRPNEVVTTLTISRDRYEDGIENRLQDGDGEGETRSKLPRVFAYGAFRQYGRASAGLTSHVENLFRSETLLPNPQKWLYNLPKSHFDDVARALRIVIAGEATFGIIEKDAAVERCYLTSTVERSGQPVVTGRTPLDAVSSGFRSVLAMACDVFAGLIPKNGEADFDGLEEARAIVLIDEIEAHLHPRWKMRIMAGLREALPKVTFMATTHDPLCLRGMEDDEVRVLQHAPSEYGAYVSRVEVLERPPSASTMTVEQLLTSDLFQLLSTDSADLDLALAKMADEKAVGARSSLTEHERQAISAHERDVDAALPVGSSMAHRLVQDAVAEFLRNRAARSFEDRRALRAQTRARILEALGDGFDETR